MLANLTFEEAAASTEGSHYALSMIRKAKIRSGQAVLVNGATGAIGRQGPAHCCPRTIRVERRARRRRSSVMRDCVRCLVGAQWWALAWLKHALSGSEVHVVLAFGSRGARECCSPCRAVPAAR